MGLGLLTGHAGKIRNAGELDILSPLASLLWLIGVQNKAHRVTDALQTSVKSKILKLFQQ